MLVLSLACCVCAENIDPYNTGAQFAWGENVGWLNFEPSYGGGVQVSADKVEGFVWAENIGWINLSPAAYGGVTNDGSGNLSGFAWGENVGWINFAPVVPNNPTDYGVKIDGEGRFNGWAWGENIGWISFDAAQAWNAQACVVTIEDLASFAVNWLAIGPQGVDLADYGTLADHWLDFCPDAWPF